MLDLVTFELIAGDGGHGRVSFRREKYIPKGGPDGGNGGSGGSIILVGSKHLSTLGAFAGIKQIKADNGVNGGGKKQEGARAEDLRIEVPVGTIVWLLAENKSSFMGRMRRAQPEGSRQYIQKFEQYWMEGGQGLIPLRDEDVISKVESESKETKERKPRVVWDKTISDGIDNRTLTPNAQAEAEPGVKLAEIIEDGQEVVICKGGRGGKGNTLFASSSNTTPWEAEYGQRGEKKVVVLELKLLADVGLVGFPSVGKSTLLSKITRANPKIASYPFTTLEPKLGILYTQGVGGENHKKSELVIADLPGLIEGASQGKGLGLQFLRHVERCQKLLFLLALEESSLYDQAKSDRERATELWGNYQTLLGELEKYDPILLSKPQQLVINKIDLYASELQAEIVAVFKKQDLEVYLLSTVTGAGLNALVESLVE